MKLELESLEERTAPSIWTTVITNISLPAVQNTLNQEIQQYQQTNGLLSVNSVLQVPGVSSLNPQAFLIPGQNGKIYGPIGTSDDQIHAQVQGFLTGVEYLYFTGQLDNGDVTTAVLASAQMNQDVQQADLYLFAFAIQVL